jgi:hypothetical protein
VSDESPPRGKSLSRGQFDEVMRRASELAAREAELGEGDLPETEVLRIAREVGLSERHVRQAMMEVRAGSSSSGLAGRLLGPGLVRASRVVPGTTAQLSERVDEFMVAGRLLQRVRRSQTFLQYRPAVDWISQLARAASATSKKYFVASARSVEVRLEDVDEGRTLVEFVVDPGIREDYVASLALGGGAAALGGGIGSGVAVSLVAPLALAVAGGVVVVGGVAYVAVRWAGRAHRRKVLEVHAEVEGILDRLESGDILDPPPSAWRRWVERQFHGARRLFDPYDGG